MMDFTFTSQAADKLAEKPSSAGRGGSPPFQHILVAIDGSVQSAWAADAAGRLARALSAKLTLVHVAGVPMILAGEIGYVQFPPTRDTRDDGEQMLRTAAAQVPAGVEVERVVMVDAHNAARVSLRNVAVVSSAVLGSVGEGFGPLGAALNAGRVAAAAEMLGLADEAFTRTTGYLKERQQFNKTIGEFQGLQHRAAQLYCEIEFTRSAVLKALQGVADGAATAAAIAATKATPALRPRATTTAAMGRAKIFSDTRHCERSEAISSGIHSPEIASSR